MEKSSNFMAKLLNKVSCFFHRPSNSAVVPRPPPQQLVICYGGVGVNLGSMKSTEVPMNYVSSSVTFRELLEQSGVELETTVSQGWVVIWCEFTEVESTLKLVEAIVKGKEREKKSSSLKNM